MKSHGTGSGADAPERREIMSRREESMVGRRDDPSLPLGLRIENDPERLNATRERKTPGIKC